MRRRLAPLAVLLAALALPAPAGAHATLQDTVPARGAQLPTAPGQVELRFSEPVETAFGAIRVFDARGRRVDAGEAFHPGGRGAAVAVRLRSRLPEGGYTATYRVVSADSHPVSGGYVFSVGRGAAPAATVDELLSATSRSGPVTSVAFAGARAVQFGAIALAVGVLAFLLIVWRPALREAAGEGREWAAASAAFARRLRRLLGAAAVAGLASSAAALVLQGATAGGTSAWAALDPGVLGDVLATRFGLVWGLALPAWALVAAGLRAGPRVLAVPVLALALLPALGGHAGVQSPRALMLGANVVHVLAIGAWMGGIAVLVLALRGATAALAPPDRTRLLAGTVGRFSAMAGVAVAAILATGLGQSLVGVGIEEPGRLLDTAYGRAVLVKLGLFAGLVALGWVSRTRLLPALRAAARGATAPGRAGALLRRTLRAEVAVGVAALAVTGALAGHAPSSAQPAGPFSTSAPIGPARLEATVEPARPGANELHLYLFDRRDGTQYDATKELTVTAELPERSVAPIELSPEKAGPGHYVIGGAALGLAGEWRLEVTARVSDFDQFTTTFDVPIR